MAQRFLLLLLAWLIPPGLVAADVDDLAVVVQFTDGSRAVGSAAWTWTSGLFERSI